MANPLRLLVAEDDSLLRRTLIELLELTGDIQVVADVSSGNALVEQASVLRPDVVLTDIDMPHLDGIEATRLLKQRFPDLPIVILTKFGDDDNLFRALRAGADGYVLKDASVEEIRTAVKEAAAGMSHLNPHLVARVLHEFTRMEGAAKERKAVFSELTRREIEVLELLGKGRRNREIAEELCLAEKTVKAHVGAVLRKLHVNDRTEAALLAQRHQLGGS